MPTLYNICHKVAKVETEPVGGFNRHDGVKIMNIFMSDCHPTNITFFSDLIVELDGNYNQFSNMDETLLNAVKTSEKIPHLGDIYTQEVFKRFYVSILEKYAFMDSVSIKWNIDGRHSTFSIDGWVISNKMEFWKQIHKFKPNE